MYTSVHYRSTSKEHVSKTHTSTAVPVNVIRPCTSGHNPMDEYLPDHPPQFGANYHGHGTHVAWMEKLREGCYYIVWRVCAYCVHGKSALFTYIIPLSTVISLMLHPKYGQLFGCKQLHLHAFSFPQILAIKCNS